MQPRKSDRIYGVRFYFIDFEGKLVYFSPLALVFFFCYSLCTMKKEIHPQYFENAKITCACGNVFTLGSTKEAIEVEICSNCHPFYTGNDKVLDTAGRVEKFKTKRAAAKKS